MMRVGRIISTWSAELTEGTPAVHPDPASRHQSEASIHKVRYTDTDAAHSGFIVRAGAVLVCWSVIRVGRCRLVGIDAG